MIYEIIFIKRLIILFFVSCIYYTRLIIYKRFIVALFSIFIITNYWLPAIAFMPDNPAAG